MPDLPNHAAPIIAPRSDGPRSGILVLRNAVAAYFEANAIPAQVAKVGLKYRSFQLNVNAPGGANRVVFIPGEFDGTPEPKKPRKYGTLSRMTRNSASVYNPRELLSWERPITISIWSGPQPGQNQDEGLNIATAEDLLEKTVQAMAVFGGSLHYGAILINAPPVENQFGAELLVGLTQVGPLYDIEYDYVQAKIEVPAVALE